MKRRAILVAAGAWFAVGSTYSFSQAGKFPSRIAFLIPGTQEGFLALLAAFRSVLKDLGYVEGRDISIEVRWAESRPERLPALAAELVALSPDVIVTASSAGVAACKNATSSIPIVFAATFSPVEQGFVSSLHGPGGNITGVIVYADLTQKLIELAREALPTSRRLAILVGGRSISGTWSLASPGHPTSLEALSPTAGAPLGLCALTGRHVSTDKCQAQFRPLRCRRH